jgi:hypothetical protein
MLMKTLTTLLLTLSCLVSSVFGGTLTETEADDLKKDINSMMKLFESGNAQALIDHTHEVIFELAGGKEAFEALTKEAVAQVMKSGVKFLESELGTPTEVHPAGKYEVCFVPRTSVMEFQGRKVKSVAFMIAARTPGTKTWKYLDGSSLRENPEMLGKLFPDLDPKVVLPTNTVDVL